MSEYEVHKNSYQRFTQAVELIQGALTLFVKADRLIGHRITSQIIWQHETEHFCPNVAIQRWEEY